MSAPAISDADAADLREVIDEYLPLLVRIARAEPAFGYAREVTSAIAALKRIDAALPALLEDAQLYRGLRALATGAGATP